MAPLQDATIVFVLGAPGSGKGTQCAKIVEKYGWTHLSAGDLLRAEVANGSELGQQAQELMAAGQMVPTSLVLDLLVGAMTASESTTFLVDGFPRKLDQLEEFEAKIQPADFVLAFTLPEEAAVERLVKRGETSGRADDNEETIRNRLQVFYAESQPVIDALKDSGRVAEIDAQASVDEVFAVVEEHMDMLTEKAAAKQAAAAAAAEAAAAEPAAADEGEGAAAPADAPAPEAEAEAVPAPAAPVSLPEGAKIVFVLGAPGAGKGTQCAKIVDSYGWTHLSTGDLLRKEVAAGSEIGAAAAEIMRAGGFVPTSLILDLLMNAMAASGADRFLVDGFPRALDQLQEFEAKIRPADFVLVFTLPEEAAVQRLVKRGETSGRADDNEETIRSRMQVFYAESQPVIDSLKESGRVAEIDAQGSVDEVFGEVAKVLDSLEGRAPQEQEAAAPEEAAPAEAAAEEAPAADAPAEEAAAPAAEGEEAAPAAEEPAAPAAEPVSLPEGAKIVFVLGAPGAGKGTQCAKIVDSYGWTHLSTGDLLRKEVAAGSEIGAAAAEIMRAGGFVPTSLILDLLMNAMAASGADRFLVDGFPRALDQLQEFEAKIRPADFVLVFTLPEEAAVQRLVKRGETSGRADDNEETIRSRMQVFYAESQPVIDSLKESGRVAEIDAQGSVDEVFGEVAKVLDSLEGRAPQEQEAAAAEEAAPAEAAEPEAPTAEDQAEAVARLAAGVTHLVVVSGPSGVGKGTLINRLMSEHGDRFGFSTSHTTRGPRPGEEDGVHYHFVTDKAKLESDIAAGLFLEHAAVHGNIYGTSLGAVAAVCASGKIPLLDIDVQGATKVKAGVVGDRATLIFVAPPSLEELEARLRGRGTETEEKIQLRLSNAAHEMELSSNYTEVVTNGEFEQAYLDFKRAIAAHIPGAFPPEALQPVPAKAASKPTTPQQPASSKPGTPLPQPPVGDKPSTPPRPASKPGTPQAAPAAASKPSTPQAASKPSTPLVASKPSTPLAAPAAPASKPSTPLAASKPSTPLAASKPSTPQAAPAAASKPSTPLAASKPSTPLAASKPSTPLAAAPAAASKPSTPLAASKPGTPQLAAAPAATSKPGTPQLTKPVTPPPAAAAASPAAAAISAASASSPAASGSGVADVRALPVRKYMDHTVVPILREALRALNDSRPADPLQYLADYLLAARAKMANGGQQ